uniref:Uncharacterized protein n=1 Tax=Seriola lalandi dorsalis TaxID=1841481 RepID=A0A3B4WN53_SERLL
SSSGSNSSRGRRIKNRFHVWGYVSRSALKQPRSCNIFKALFCCFQAQDGPKPPPPLPPPSQQALLDSQENGTVVKVTLLLFYCSWMAFFSILIFLP